MSVYIKNMELPKGHPVCIVIDAVGQARRYDLNNDKYADDELFEAITISPHGRLGDLDELYSHLNEWYLTNNPVFTKEEALYIRAMLFGITEAPTVIPAEKGET